MWRNSSLWISKSALKWTLIVRHSRVSKHLTSKYEMNSHAADSVTSANSISLLDRTLVVANQASRKQ